MYCYVIVITMTSQELREHLEGVLGIAVPPLTWEEVEREGFAAKVTDFTKTLIEVEKEVRFWLRRGGTELPQREPEATTLPIPAERRSPLAASRRNAVSLLLAREASKSEVVRSFRRDVLEGQLIRFEQIGQWVQRQANTDGVPTRWLTVPLPPKSKMKGNIMTITPPIRRVEEGVVAVRSLKYATPDFDAAINKPVTKDGVLDRLRLASEYCTRLYGWQGAQATIFILTGRVPHVLLCRANTQLKTIQATARITLEIDPALAPKEVADIYQKYRSRIQGRRRELSEKHITLAQFFAESPDGESLKAGMKRWNRKYRKWKYTGVTNFGRDRNAAMRRLLQPGVPVGFGVSAHTKRTETKENQRKTIKKGART